MSIVARRFAATPARSAIETWSAITSLISNDGSEARIELQSVKGILASLIADEMMKDAPITIAGNGPRLRIYCVYGSKAIEGEDCDENALSWIPTEGAWTMYVPCDAEDLEWVNAALKKSSSRIDAYDMTEKDATATAAMASPSRAELSIDEEVFKRL